LREGRRGYILSIKFGTHSMTDKRIAVRFFATELGTEPVRDWLKSLDEPDRFRIGEDIKTVEFGWPIGMPVCRPLGQGLYEVRTNLKNRIARTLFGIVGENMVLLHGFIKKSQTTPSGDLELARKRLRTVRTSA
jgi:phage-related protein